MATTEEQNKFEGWAVVEIFGHIKHAGFVRTEYFGSACMMRIDIPPLDEKTFEREKYFYDEHETRKVKMIRPGRPGVTKYYGSAAIFSLTPCSEEFARRVNEETAPAPYEQLATLGLIAIEGESPALDALERGKTPVEVVRDYLTEEVGLDEEDLL